MQLDTSIHGSKGNNFRAVGVINTKNYWGQIDDIKVLHKYVEGKCNGSSAGIKENNGFFNWAWVNITNSELLQSEVDNLKKPTPLSKWVTKGTWTLPDADGNRFCYFRKEKDAVLCLEGFKRAKNLYNWPISISRSNTTGLDNDLYVFKVADKDLGAFFKFCKPLIKWEECGQPKYNLKKLFGKVQGVADDPVDKYNTIALFENDFDVDLLANLTKLLTAQDIHVVGDNAVVLTPSNRRVLDPFLPEFLRLESMTRAAKSGDGGLKKILSQVAQRTPPDGR